MNDYRQDLERESTHSADSQGVTLGLIKPALWEGPVSESLLIKLRLSVATKKMKAHFLLS